VAIRIALATSPGSDLISKDDEILAAALRRRGAIVEIPNWSDSSVEWSSFDLVAIRTTWDYQLRLGEFLSWASRVSETTKLVNDFSLLEWNAHKSYMLDLASSGVPTVPTVVLKWSSQLESALHSFDCEKVIVKPEIGASATDAEVHPAQNIDAISEHVTRLTENGKALMQPFMDRIQTEGELSLAWIDGRVVHAIQKTPAPGDFRVQVEHGGSNVRIEPPDDAIEIAKKCIDSLSVQPVFARVDCVRDEKGTLRLMELELIEPELMFEWAPESADILADRIEHIALPAASL